MKKGWNVQRNSDEEILLVWSIVSIVCCQQPVIVSCQKKLRPRVDCHTNCDALKLGQIMVKFFLNAPDLTINSQRRTTC